MSVELNRDQTGHKGPSLSQVSLISVYFSPCPAAATIYDFSPFSIVSPSVEPAPLRLAAAAEFHRSVPRVPASGLWCLQSKVFSQSLAAAEKGRAPLHRYTLATAKN